MSLPSVENALATLIAQEAALPGLTLATKIINNILSHQDDPKYRKVKTESAALQKLLGVDGGLE
eukprot:6319974-Prymnesium_polylepis.1